MESKQEYTVKKVQNPHPIDVTVPGSKSITNRALLIAALCEGTSVLDGVLFSDDSRNFLASLRSLDFSVTADERNRRVTIGGCGGAIPKEEGEIYVGSAGTAARFLTAFLALSKGRYRIDASEQMRKRPMKELLFALESLGARFSYEKEEYHFPFTVFGRKCPETFLPEEFLGDEREKNRLMQQRGGNRVSVNVDKSSQFLSALLISSVLFDEEFLVEVTGSHGMAYVDMTLRIMEQFGLKTEASEKSYRIPANAGYTARNYRIEPDLSAACYFYAAGALLGVPAKVSSVYPDSMQGDIAFLSVLCDMGCSMRREEDGILLIPPTDRKLRGGRWDLSAFSDQALTLAAVAPFADGEVVIENIGHIRYQECDRIGAILENLKALGVECEKRGDSIFIQAKPDCRTDRDKAVIKTYEDHRVAMSFALTGLCRENVVIRDPSCCRKTFETYFETLEERVIR